MKFLFYPLFLSVLFACTCQKDASVGASSPEEAVHTFVMLSAQAKDPSDKAKLAALCSGPLKRALEGLSEDVFRMSYLNSKIDVKEVRVLEKVLKENTAQVRYQVVLQNQQGADPTQEMNEREVDLVLQNHGWFLEDIRPKGKDQVAFTHGMIF